MTCKAMGCYVIRQPLTALKEHPHCYESTSWLAATAKYRLNRWRVCNRSVALERAFGERLDLQRPSLAETFSVIVPAK